MRFLPILSRSGSVPARALRAGLSALAALFLGTCTDNSIAPERTGRLLIQPVFDRSALFAPLAIDNLRLIVVRPPSEVLKTITQSFPANADAVTITATDIQLESNTEDLLVTIELYAGANLLFTGTQTVTVSVGITPQPASIPMLYQGPGSNLAALTLTPRDTTVTPGSVYSYQVTAADALQQPVTSFYVGWQASAGTITGTGQFTAPATRDTITITVSAPAPNTTKDSTRVFVIAAPGSLTITGGDAQTAQVVSRLPQLLAVRVNGTDNLPLPGVVVGFAPTTGGGSVDSATATTDAQGIARTGATLGGTVGPQTFTASSTGLTSVVFTQTATAVVGGIVWNGSVSNAWNTAGNWTPAVVPGLADNVTIPAGPSIQPVVSFTANMNDLTIATGATVTLAGSFTFNVAGNLAANGALVVSSGTPTIQLSGAAKTLVGNVASATVTGTVALAGTTNVTGNVAVSGGAARLDIGGNTLQVGGGFSTGSGGRLGMTGGQLNIIGSAAFAGGDEAGLLTAGTLTIGGNFTQSGSGSPTSFVGSGTHTVFLSGTGAQTVNFGTPGFAASRFQNVIIANTVGGVTATSDLYATGTPGATPTAVRTLSGNGSTLFTTILDVSSFTFNNLLLNFAGTSLVRFDTVTFQAYATTATPLTISHPGAASSFTFRNVTFTVTATTGFYISATDANPADGAPLVIDMTNPTPASPAGRVQTAGGAVVNWGPPVGGRTWTGATSTNWSVATNWNPQVVPTNTDDVVIPSGPSNMPAVTTSCSAKTLTVNAGATLNLGTINCSVAGNVFADGAITGTGAVAIATPAQIRGNFPSLILSAKITQTAPGVTATGNVTVTGPAGSYVIGGQPLSMGGNLGVQGGARLVMLNPADLVTVTGNAVFSGGFELDSLNAGTLSIGGNLTQNTGSTGDTYHTSGTHQTVFTGNNPTIFFATPGDVPGTSHFQQFTWTGTGTLNLTSDAYAHVSFTTTSTSPVTISGAGHLFQVGNYAGAGPITLNNTRLGLNEPSGGPLALNNATFQGLAASAIQLTVSHPGTGGPFTFDNLTFSVTPTGAGRYLSATDADGPTPTPLTINVTNSTPASPGGFVTVANGAVVNWPPVTPIRTWGGTSSNNWFVSANWVGGVAPASADNVVIPAGTPFVPTIGSSTAVNDLTVQTGANLSLGDITLTVTGNLDASGSIDGCCGDFIGLSGGTLRGNFNLVVLNVSPGGAVSLNGATTLINSTVQLAGELILNGNTLNAGQGTVSTLNGTGLLTMTNPLDQVIAGTTNFTGGDETGRLTAGVLRTQSLNQGGTVPTSFLTGGNHKVILGGPLSSTVTLTNPGSSRFQELDVSGVTATLTLGSNVTVAGQLISLPISRNGPTIAGTGFTLTAGGADVAAPSGFTALTMNGVPLVLSGGAISGFSRVTFQNQNPNGTHLTVNNVGQATPYLFGGLTFTDQLSAGGFYIVANDLDGASPNPLTINVLASTPASGAGVSQANNGAVINWPASGNVFTWDGSADNDWFNPANWDRNAVPGPIDDVILVPITNQPALTNSAIVNNLTSNTGSILDLKGFVLVANGNVDLAGSIVDGVGGGGVSLTGTANQVRGTISAEAVVVGSYVMNGSFIISGNLSVQGSLDLGGNTAQVGGSFLTINSGVLVMTNSLDVLDVTGDAIFTGGSTAGLLKSGRITIGGTFSQIGTNSKQSFAADPGHLTQLSANPASISFTDPGPTLSHFGDLAEFGFGAVFTLNSDVTVLGGLSGGDGFGGTMVGSSCPTVLTLTGFSTSGPLKLDCVRLVIDDPGGSNIGINGVTFANLPTNVTQLTIRHPGLVAGNFTTGFLTFVPLTSGDTGFYIQAEDTDGVSPLLIVSPFATNVGDGSPFTKLVGGATVIWP